jgi:hypothetical protein
MRHKQLIYVFYFYGHRLAQTCVDYMISGLLISGSAVRARHHSPENAKGPSAYTLGPFRIIRPSDCRPSRTSIH